MARAGQFGDRVTFQAEVQTPDGGGGYELTWQPVATEWGHFMPERGRERVAEGRIEAAVAGVLRVRYSAVTAALTAANRAVIDGVPYNIGSVTQPDRRNRIVEMVIERGVAT